MQPGGSLPWARWIQSYFFKGGAEPTDTFKNARLPYDRRQGAESEHEDRWRHALSKPVQWRWRGGACSVSMSDEEHFHVSSIPWPVPSPDLTESGFFLWGCLKECVYRNRLHTAQELKRAILDEIATINQEMLRQVFWQFCKSFKTMCCKWRRPPSRCYLSNVINN